MYRGRRYNSGFHIASITALKYQLYRIDHLAGVILIATRLYEYKAWPCKYGVVAIRLDGSCKLGSHGKATSVAVKTSKTSIERLHGMSRV